MLDKLPVANGVAFDSHDEEHNATCLPDTRVQLLHDIRKWVDGIEGKGIFWLNGMAGTGKSTVSRTVARSFHDRGQLGASFFFKRGEGDRGGASKFFTTLATQLVITVAGLAPHVKNAIDADPAIPTKTMRDQFTKLILEPLSQLQVVRKAGTIVIVVDALDECEREEDVRTIIHLFSQTRTLQSPRLRFFTTSRPELPIRLGFNAIDGMYQNLMLHNIAEPVIKHDLTVYFERELDKVKHTYNKFVHESEQLPSDWPQSSEIESLVTMAIPLFIFAATTCRFLADYNSGDPGSKLQDVLAQGTKAQESKLDGTYLPVLNQMLTTLVSRREKDNVLKEFRDIVGSIVILASPLSTSALARMLNTAQKTVDNRLRLLHSVLDVPSLPDSPVRLFHLSFRDFLLDPEKRQNPNASQFWVNEKKTHGQLAEHCLRVMNQALRKDICGIQWPGTRRTAIESKTIANSLLPEVQYACQYWAFHIQQAADRLSDGGRVHRFLQQYFLHWLEALSLIGRASESVQSIRTLRLLLQVF